jgi:predicted enzyme related to lactoylglutathione lyase
MDRLATFDAVTIDCSDPVTLARFWGSIFDTKVDWVSSDADPKYVDLEAVAGVVPRLRFQRVPELKRTKNRLHLDLLVDDPEEARARIEKLGGHRSVEEAFTEYGFTWIVMRDPEGNEFCIGPVSDAGR